MAPSHTQQGRRADDPGIFPGDTDLPAPPPPRPWGAAPELRDPRVYKCAPAALACSPPYPHIHLRIQAMWIKVFKPTGGHLTGLRAIVAIMFVVAVVATIGSVRGLIVAWSTFKFGG